ncbi:MAG: dockerin type I repeat-containing protein, partial [Oscillospiraceae bacterium]|nr:dockerin type I repeat-containing protein [Oscillospiraceae bacterium]
MKKVKKIASFACAILLACSAVCPITGHAYEVEIDGVTYCWNGLTYRPANVSEIDTATLKSKEDIVINGVMYSFKEEAWGDYIYEGVVDGVTYIASVYGPDGGCFEGIVSGTNIPKDIVIGGISYSFFSCYDSDFELASKARYKGIIDGIPHIIDVDLDSGEILSDMMCPENFVEESTGLTYSLVEIQKWGCGIYESVVGEITYIREMEYSIYKNNDMVDITVNGVTYSAPLGSKAARANGLYYAPHKVCLVNNFDDDEPYAVTYVYNAYDNNDLENVDPASILSEINGYPVFTDPRSEADYIGAFHEEQMTAYLERLENSNVMTLEDEIEIPAVKGDATGDGEVDILDVIVANKAILGQKTLTSEQTQALDIDNNGIVDTTDSLAIMQYITGLT